MQGQDSGEVESAVFVEYVDNAAGDAELFRELSYGTLIPLEEDSRAYLK